MEPVTDAQHELLGILGQMSHLELLTEYFLICGIRRGGPAPCLGRASREALIGRIMDLAVPPGAPPGSPAPVDSHI